MIEYGLVAAHLQNSADSTVSEQLLFNQPTQDKKQMSLFYAEMFNLPITETTRPREFLEMTQPGACLPIAEKINEYMRLLAKVISDSGHHKMVDWLMYMMEVVQQSSNGSIDDIHYKFFWLLMQSIPTFSKNQETTPEFQLEAHQLTNTLFSH